MSFCRLKNEKDMLEGNINRIMVSDDPKEIASMYHYANVRLAAIFRESFDEACNKPAEGKEKGEDEKQKENERQFIPPECSPGELPFG